MRYGGRRPLSALQQMLHLRNSHVYPGEGSASSGSLTWRLSRRPSGLSREYDLRLTFSEGSSPSMYVDRPDLVLLAEGKTLPHVYSQRPTRLCLYLPGASEWRPWDRFDLTILPWTDLWLLHFEDWLARGCKEWRGGGVHPDPASNASGGRRQRRILQNL